MNMPTQAQETKARELLQILSIWGMTVSDAKSITFYMRRFLLPMDNKEFQALNDGASIKPGQPHAPGI